MALNKKFVKGSGTRGFTCLCHCSKQGVAITPLSLGNVFSNSMDTELACKQCFGLPALVLWKVWPKTSYLVQVGPRGWYLGTT